MFFIECLFVFCLFVCLFCPIAPEYFLSSDTYSVLESNGSFIIEVRRTVPVEDIATLSKLMKPIVDITLLIYCTKIHSLYIQTPHKICTPHTRPYNTQVLHPTSNNINDMRLLPKRLYRLTVLYMCVIVIII